MSRRLAEGLWMVRRANGVNNSVWGKIAKR
jgi:hypothetical protein